MEVGAPEGPEPEPLHRHRAVERQRHRASVLHALSQQHANGSIGEAPHEEGDGRGRGLIEPLRVVDCEEDGLAPGGAADEARRARPDAVQLQGGITGEVRTQQCDLEAPPLWRGDGGQLALERLQQVRERLVGKAHLGLRGSRLQDPEAACPGALASHRPEAALADPGWPLDHQARRCGWRGGDGRQELVELREFLGATDKVDGHGSSSSGRSW